jgi:hypothetical protein
LVKYQISESTEWNLTSGGECCIFDLVRELKKALKMFPDISEEIEKNLKPDFFKEQPDNYELPLEFCVLKITNKISRSGRDIKKVFRQWDVNNSGHLDATEVLFGIKENL